MNLTHKSTLDTSASLDILDYQGASDWAIQHHYDVSNDFYKLWLDRTISYSCALWSEHESFESLESAQVRKLDYFVKQAQAKGANHVLEVGCGWGAMLKRLVEIYGVKQVTGLTLSQAQLDNIESFQHTGIQARLENWFNHCPNELYDSIISIEAFEAFVKPGLSQVEKVHAYHKFFQCCHQWLKPSGFLTLQTIAYGSMCAKEIKPLIINEIFPESDLPRFVEIAMAIEPLFEIVAIRNDRQDYVRTLKAWFKRLKANRTEAVCLIGEKRVIDYEQYLQHSIFGFASGAQNLLRITLRRIDKSSQS
ncbi:class I SAM-dependent methyltransferase [Leptolyngbya sp. FACHB-321]|uniref:SAM-dependent methyltransferase n=1 Tax=Leptolyngbya sp. FACHB-321 TaxID=2692807 RepID=UPI0016873566|nr:cyclopropane-fatty-acyl-phospholipid synthase family protein [Leptolyngbya sp. FACHB-321]MBD2037726.1 class I SAM-dependent methyltransferase [Leptolyngbya sp. FACHB-321]